MRRLPRVPYVLTPSDRLALAHARKMIQAAMDYEGLRKSDLAMLGIPEQTVRWFLNLEGNITVGALNRIANATGYQVEIRLRRIPERRASAHGAKADHYDMQDAGEILAEPS